jgi:hypothetical protein
MSDNKIDETAQKIIANSYIYLICKRPRISFSKESFKYENGIVSGHINFKIKGVSTEIAFSYEFPLLDDAVELKLAEYPYLEFSTYNAKGEEVRFLPATHISMLIDNPLLTDIEVLYVGQAFGENGSRTAFDRLKSHSTLQKILAELPYKEPDSEIFILPFEFSEYRFFSCIDGRAKNVISDYRDVERFKNIMDTPLSKYQQVCLTEASLIRYFQPKYNVIYKENFPNEKHKILESCYELDFSGLVVEISTNELPIRLYSETVCPQIHHICNIDLHNPDVRHGFFYFSDGDGGSFKMQNVINS